MSSIESCIELLEKPLMLKGHFRLFLVVIWQVEMNGCIYVVKWSTLVRGLSGMGASAYEVDA